MNEKITRKIENVTITIEKRISQKTKKPYIAVIGHFHNYVNENGEESTIFLGFEPLANTLNNWLVEV